MDREKNKDNKKEIWKETRTLIKKLFISNIIILFLFIYISSVLTANYSTINQEITCLNKEYYYKSLIIDDILINKNYYEINKLLIEIIFGIVIILILNNWYYLNKFFSIKT